MSEHAEKLIKAIEETRGAFDPEDELARCMERYEEQRPQIEEERRLWAEKRIVGLRKKQLPRRH